MREGHVLGVALLAALLAAAGARADGAERAEGLVRQLYFEALPYAEIRSLGPGAAERLVGMLHDREEGEHHANVVLALGILAAPGSYEALRSWSEGLEPGEVDRAGFRARRVLPFAMGHLSSTDPRAGVWLAQRASRSAAPDWWFGELRGERLAARLQRAAVQGLALAPGPAARRELERLAARPEVAADPHLARTLREALDQQAVVSRAGVEAVLPRDGAIR